MSLPEILKEPLWQKPPYFFKIYSYLASRSGEEEIHTNLNEISASTFSFQNNHKEVLKNNQVARVINFLEDEKYIKVEKTPVNLKVRVLKLLTF